MIRLSHNYRVLGWGFVACCASLVLVATRRVRADGPVASVSPAPIPVVTVAPPPAPMPTASPAPTNDPLAWFQRVKPFCNAVEVAVLQRETPPPPTIEGAGYHAACFALAGRIDEARRIIDSLGASAAQSVAAAIVFDVGHPVADAGDDKSAGPIMELVVGYSPDNYMAVYHAGMAEFALGQRQQARANLSAFMKLYAEEDGWRASARRALRQLGDSTRDGKAVERPDSSGT